MKKWCWIFLLWNAIPLYQAHSLTSQNAHSYQNNCQRPEGEDWLKFSTFSIQCLYPTNDQPLLEIPILNSSFSYGEFQQKVRMKLGSWTFTDRMKKNIAVTTWKVSEYKENAHVSLSPREENAVGAAPEIFIKRMKDGSIHFKVSVQDSSINNLKFEIYSRPEEQIFGLGEQFSHFNLKGHRVPIFVEEQGVGRGDPGASGIAKLLGIAGDEYTSYAPIPSFLTSDLRGCLLNTHARTIFDFTHPDKIIIEAQTNELEGTIFTGSSPEKLIELLTEKTGRFRPLPEWAYGTWLGVQGGKEQVLNILDETFKAGNPVSAIWIQDWVGKRKTTIGSRLWWNWQADTIAYPDFTDFCTQLKKKNIKVLGYINPFLAPGTPLSSEALEKGYVVKKMDGTPYEVKAGGFSTLLLDLTHPDCRTWIKNIIKTNMIDAGLSGWMADFGEWLPLDAQLYDGRSAVEFHNEYPVEWQRINEEAVQEAGKENEIVIFNRSGYTRSAEFSQAFWAGDQLCSWGKNDGLPSALTALLSSGLSGLSVNHSDIGGYTSGNFITQKFFRDEELFYRWCEMAAFTPLFRTHEGLTPEKNHQFYTDEKSQAFFAKMGRIHWALRDYLSLLNQEAVTLGHPMIRPLWYHYPQDTHTYHLQTQFMLGESMIVIPVLSPDVTEVNGYLPEGEWEHVFTGEIITRPGYYKLKAPLGQPLVFVNRSKQPDLISVIRFDKK